MALVNMFFLDFKEISLWIKEQSADIINKSGNYTKYIWFGEDCVD